MCAQARTRGGRGFSEKKGHEAFDHPYFSFSLFLSFPHQARMAYFILVLNAKDKALGVLNTFIHSSINTGSWKLNIKQSSQGLFFSWVGQNKQTSSNDGVSMMVRSALKKIKAGKRDLRVRALLYTQGVQEKLL